MIKTITLLLCLVLLITGSALASTLRIRDKESQDDFSATTIQEHTKLKGLLLIGWSLFAGYVGYRMLTDKLTISEGDVKLVGNLFLISSSVFFIWGIFLIF